MENPFKKITNKIKKVAKVAVPAAILTVAPLKEAVAQNKSIQTEDPAKKTSVNVPEKEEPPNTKNLLEPIIVHDPNDPKLKEYKDSLVLYNLSELSNDYLKKLGFTEVTEYLGFVDAIESETLAPEFVIRPDFSNFHNYKNSESDTYGEKIIFKVVPGNNETYSVGYSPNIKPIRALEFRNPIYSKMIDDLEEIYNNAKKYTDDKTMEYSPEYKKYILESKKLAKELGIRENCLLCDSKNIVPQYKKPKQEVIYVLEAYDSNLWGWNGDNHIVGYYNKGDRKGRIDVTLENLKGMGDKEFHKVFPDTGLNRQSIIDLYEAREKINNSLNKK